MFLCFGFFLHTVLVHVVPHATGLGILAASAANILATIGGLSIAGKIIMGSAADRIGNRLAIIISSILISAALLWLGSARELWMLYLFAIIFGFGYGGFAATQLPIVAELFGLRSVGIILGFTSFSFAVGGAIGPFLGGWLFDVTGEYTVSFLVTAGVAIIGLILAISLRPISSEGGTNESKRSPGVY
jgi:MFS family permease